MATYMNVDREKIQKAFMLANTAASAGYIRDEPTPALRKRFREIAKLIWQACGERGDPAQWRVQLDRGAGWITVFESKNEDAARAKYKASAAELAESANRSIRLLRPDLHTELIEHSRVDTKQLYDAGRKIVEEANRG